MHNGKLVFLDSSPKEISDLLPDGVIYQVSIKEYEENRTIRQNSYFHALISWWSRINHDMYGNQFTPSQAKTALKLTIGWYDDTEIKTKSGFKRMRVFRDTHNLSKSEFNALIDLIASWCIDNWQITPPYYE